MKTLILLTMVILTTEAKPLTKTIFSKSKSISSLPVASMSDLSQFWKYVEIITKQERENRIASSTFSINSNNKLEKVEVNQESIEGLRRNKRSPNAAAQSSGNFEIFSIRNYTYLHTYLT